jgi:hypothetical protein
MHSNAIIIFARQPHIHRAHGHEPFAALPWEDLDLLFSALLSDLVMNASKVATADVLLFREPRFKLDPVIGDLGERVVLLEAVGSTQGEQTEDAIHKTFNRGYSRVLVVLDNQPTLRPADFERYLDQLHYEHECIVAGPSVDGQWFLLGMKADYGELFHQDALGKKSELLRRLCKLPAEMFLVSPRYLLNSGINLQRLYRELESMQVRDSNFPQRTFDVFQKFDKKYRTRYALR